jgi:hypothetical protein
MVLPLGVFTGMPPAVPGYPAIWQYDIILIARVDGGGP